MRISIITASFNSASTITMCKDSVNKQTYSDIEHVIIDAASKDNTIEIIKSIPSRVEILISEPDKGIYSAINKGIELATGDIIGILNSDDFFCDNYVVENIARAFKEENIDALFGDVRFVNPMDLNKIVRYYSSKKFTPDKFKYGLMPAHPSFYVKKELFKKYGNYKDDYKIAGDYELILRFLYVYKLEYKYLEMPFVTMRNGGVSTKSLKSNLILNNEILRACKENGIKTNYFNIYSKYLTKVSELFCNR